MEKMRRILIVNPLGIGDVIFSTPLITVLKNFYPESYIGYICNKRVTGLVSANPDIDKVFVYEKDEYRDAWKRSKLGCLKRVWGFLGTIKKEKFDISIDFTLGYQYSMLLMLSGIKKRIGFNYRSRGRFLTSKVDLANFDDKHVVEYYLDMLKPLGIEVEKGIVTKVCVLGRDSEWADKELGLRGIAGKDVLVGIVCGGGASWGADARYKRWDKNKFATLADKLIDAHGVKVIFLGDDKESTLVKDVRSAMKSPSVDLSGETTVGQMAAIMKKCRAVITNDGGPLHMAVGLGVNTVSIFGPVDEKTYGPYPKSDKHFVISRSDVVCRPCYKSFRYNKCEDRVCLNSITVAEVCRAAEKVLKI